MRAGDETRGLISNRTRTCYSIKTYILLNSSYESLDVRWQRVLGKARQSRIRVGCGWVSIWAVCMWTQKLDLGS